MKAILFCLLLGITLCYNANNAISYARRYCGNYNPSYANYRNMGGDCANFVSQCLIAGGISLKSCKVSWIDNHGCLPRVVDLQSCLSQLGWKKSTGIPKKFKAGNPFFIPNQHAMIATGVNGNTITFCGHTSDVCNQKMGAPSSYLYYYQ